MPQTATKRRVIVTPEKRKSTYMGANYKPPYAPGGVYEQVKAALERMRTDAQNRIQARNLAQRPNG